MTDYISREAALEWACGNCEPHSCDGDCELVKLLKEIPTADVRPVGLLEQIEWERDTAIDQLAEICADGEWEDGLDSVVCVGTKREEEK